MSAFSPAQQPEILHAAQKDLELLQRLRESLLGLLEHLLPAQLLFRHAHWAGAAAALLYFGGNSLRLRQTLGEEYAYVRQFADSDHVFLSKKRLLLFLFLETFGELFVARVAAKRLDRWIARQAESPDAGQAGWARRLACAFCRCLGEAQSLFSAASQLHLCVFYLQGFYASLSKRLAGIKYLQAVRVEQHGFSYRRIGALMLLHLGLKLLAFAHGLRKEFLHLAADARRPRGLPEAPAPEAPLKSRAGESVGARCGVCFEKPVHPSCVPCGHLYCWECVMRSSQFKPECPGCRKPFEPREVVCLSNIQL